MSPIPANFTVDVQKEKKFYEPNSGLFWSDAKKRL